eukprot:4328825-Pleurochrysis_carterae.AAC.2
MAPLPPVRWHTSAGGSELVLSAAHRSFRAHSFCAKKGQIRRALCGCRRRSFAPRGRRPSRRACTVRQRAFGGRAGGWSIGGTRAATEEWDGERAASIRGALDLAGELQSKGVA